MLVKHPQKEWWSVLFVCAGFHLNGTTIRIDTSILRLSLMSLLECREPLLSVSSSDRTTRFELGRSGGGDVNDNVRTRVLGGVDGCISSSSVVIVATRAFSFSGPLLTRDGCGLNAFSAMLSRSESRSDGMAA